MNYFPHSPIQITDILNLLIPNPQYYLLEKSENKAHNWSFAHFKRPHSLYYSSIQLEGFSKLIPHVWAHTTGTEFEEVRVSEIEVHDYQWIFIGDKTQYSEIASILHTIEIGYQRYWKYLQTKDPNAPFLVEKNDLELFTAEGYYLKITTKGLCILAPTAHGVFNGLQTLLQILRIGLDSELSGAYDPCEIFDYPKLKVRAFHLDMKDLTPTIEYVKEFILTLGQYKYNYLFIEYEDKFPYSGQLAELKHKYAWTPEQLEEIKTLCQSVFITIVPLIQVFGHVETYLRKPSFKKLQETPDGQPMELKPYNTWSLCPLHPDSIPFAFEMVDQIAKAHPDAPFIHIGADEVYQLGSCPRCQKFLKTHTKSELYINYINKVAERVMFHKKQPVMWHDYLLKFPENLDALNKKIIPMYWIYENFLDPQRIALRGPIPNILPDYEFFHKKGHDTIGAPSISSDFDGLIPNYVSRLGNLIGQTTRAKESGSLGILITSWVVCFDPLDTQIPGVVIGGGLMWNPLSDWRVIPWENFDKCLQATYFGVKLDRMEPWFFNFACATEHPHNISEHGHLFATVNTAISNLAAFSEKVVNGRAIVESLKIGLEYRKLSAQTYQAIQQLTDSVKPYAETELKGEIIPSIDQLREFQNNFLQIPSRLNSIYDEAKHYYTEKTKEILPNELDGLVSWERYQKIGSFAQLGVHLQEMIKNMDSLFLKLFTQSLI